MVSRASLKPKYARFNSILRSFRSPLTCIAFFAYPPPQPWYGHAFSLPAVSCSAAAYTHQNHPYSSAVCI
jgi:hypothetical protein